MKKNHQTYHLPFLKNFKLKRRKTLFTVLILGITISPGFGFFDYYLGKENFWKLVPTRASISIISVFLIIIYKKFPKYISLVDLFGTTVLYMAAIHMTLAAYYTGGSASPYSLGFALVLCISGFYVYSTKKEGLFLTSILTGSYLVSSLIAPDKINWPYFLACMSVLITISVITYDFLNRRFKLEYENFIKQSQIEEKNQQLLKLDQAKTRFFTNLTHEFRTPLVSLSTALQDISQQTRLDKDLEALLQTSYTSLNEMLENINDLLSKTKSEQGFLEIRWRLINPSELIKQSLEIFQPTAKAKSLKLHFNNKINIQNKNETDQLKFYADPFKFKKIIHNLLSNAIKYTQQGEVTLTLKQDDKHLLIEVQDTGIGIPKEDLKTIFDPFTQASNNSLRDVKGTGLGLSIVKDFATAHGGEISLESQVDQGTCFRLKFLLGNDHIHSIQQNHEKISEEENLQNIHLLFPSDLGQEAKQLNNNASALSNNPRLVLVDDNPQVLQTLDYLLKKDYQLTFCQDGEEALQHISDLKPDLVISDIMMPKMNGYQLVQAIKSHPELQNIPIILLTAKVDLNAKLQGYQVGADEYISKPFYNLEVKTRIKNLLDRKKIERDYVQTHEKMISLGQLVSGISHEILNPIAYAKSAAENIPHFFNAIKKGPTLQKQEQEKIEKNFVMAIDNVQDGIRRVCEIAEALRLLRRQSDHDLGFWELNPGLEACLKLLEANFKNNISFHLKLNLKEKVFCNINQINQVFLNILINAAQALQAQSQANIWIETSLEQKNAKIIIRDDGPGIPQEALSKVFTPFFTTKPVGQGTGLGLYISQQIIDDHDGRIFVESPLKKGTQFTIELPLKKVCVKPNEFNLEKKIAFG